MTKPPTPPSTYAIETVTDRVAWDDALARLPNAHILQSWDWGAFKESWGWRPQRLRILHRGETAAAAQILHRRLPRLPLQISYVPKGPALDFNDRELTQYVMAALEAEGRRQRSILVKIDPDLWLGTDTDTAQVNESSHAVLQMLLHRGWRSSHEQIQFKNTVVVDLRPDEEALLAQMKAKTRYNIHLAERKGVRVHVGAAADMETFYRLYHETSQRDGFLIRPFNYYQDVWSRFLHAGRAHLLLAAVDDTCIAGLMMFVFGESAWYMYGASSDSYRNLMPNYLLQWRAMRAARELGCRRYDMWGAPDTFDESQPMWGVYRFKTGFGGDTWRGMGAYDYAVSHPLYHLYTVIMPKILSAMRHRHHSSELKG
jgi:peptidoglycan pentaglycine glycine transferase (the first glycine)